MVTGDLTLGGKHTVQYIDDVLQNCTLETYTILLTNVAPINLISKLAQPLATLAAFTLIQLHWCQFPFQSGVSRNDGVKTSEKFLHKSNENSGKSHQNQLSQNSGN